VRVRIFYALKCGQQGLRQTTRSAPTSEAACGHAPKATVPWCSFGARVATCAKQQRIKRNYCEPGREDEKHPEGVTSMYIVAQRIVLSCFLRNCARGVGWCWVWGARAVCAAAVIFSKVGRRERHPTPTPRSQPPSTARTHFLFRQVVQSAGYNLVKSWWRDSGK
jgi:hypothetical protein